MTENEKVLILGLGNDILSDDGVGIYAARRIKERLSQHPNTTKNVYVEEASIAGFALLDLLEGFSRAVIVDAVLDPSKEPGSISVHSLKEFTATSHLVMAHQIDLPTAVKLGEKLEIQLPTEIFIVGVVADDVTNLSEKCTPSVEAAIDKVSSLAIEIALRTREKTTSAFS